VIGAPLVRGRSTRGVSEVAKTGGLLAAIVLHNLIYPLSAQPGIGPVVFYAVYASIFVVGTWLLTREARWRGAALTTGIAVLVAGLVNSYAGSSTAALAVYLTSIAYHAVMIVVLARYRARHGGERADGRDGGERCGDPLSLYPYSLQPDSASTSIVLDAPPRRAALVRLRA